MAQATVNNGVNVEALLAAREALKGAPEATKFTWRASCKWQDGTYSKTVVQGFRGLGAEQQHRTEFSFDAEHDGRTVVYTNWHRPLQAMADAFSEAGFRISVISEPPVAPDAPDELLPPGREHPVRFVSFIFFVLEARA